MIASTEENAGGGPGIVLPRGLAIFRRFLGRIGRIELVLASVALVVVVALSGSQALLRYAFGSSLWWAQEISENTILIVYFLGISYVYKTNQDVLIDFLVKRAPIRMQILCYLFAQAMTLIFCAATVWLVYKFLPTLMNMRTPVLNLPAVITPAPLALASAMMVLTSLYYFLFGIWVFARAAPGSSLVEIEALALIAEPLGEMEF